MKLRHSVPLLALLLLAASAALLHAADPVVTNVVSAQRAGTKLVDITFDVSDADSDTLAISENISDDSGTTFAVPVTALTGDASGAATSAQWISAVSCDRSAAVPTSAPTSLAVPQVTPPGQPR